MLVLSLSICWTWPAIAQTEFATASSAWDGYSELIRLAQRELGSRRVTVTKRLNYDELRPDDAILLIHPTSSLDDRSLSSFLADGGRVGLLDDFGTGTTLLEKFGLIRIPPPLDPKHVLRNNIHLPIATPSVQLIAGAEQGRHPIAAEVDQVVTNHPMVFEHPDLTSVLRIEDRGGKPGDLAVTGVIANRGRLFALGDPSVFINLMMRYPGNRQFASGLVNYLCTSTRKSETEQPSAPTPDCRLIVVEGSFDQVGSYGDTPSFADELKERIDELRAQVENIEDEGLPSELATALAAALALWVVLTQLRTHFRAPRLTDLSFARAWLIASQVGLESRASVLGAKGTNPALSLLELDDALLETLTMKLGMQISSDADMRRQLTGRGLSSADIEQLLDLRATLRRYGERLTQGKAVRPTESELKALHERGMDVIEKLVALGDNR